MRLFFMVLWVGVLWAQSTPVVQQPKDTTQAEKKAAAAVSASDKATLLQQAGTEPVPSELDAVVKPSEKEGIPEQKPGEVEVHKKAAAAKALDALVVKLNQYWQASYNRDYAKTYPLYIQAYRDRIPLKNFLSHRRGDVQKYEIEKVTLYGDSCAYVSMRLGMKTEFMDFNKFAVRQYWTLVDGEWFLYENPGGKALFQRKSQQVANPCPLPDALKPKPKKQAKKI
ncbi:hypothetical protein [Acanthopleuribacter pedis]|uniref:Uncharacterized protein n=1 Tax=Acanthopleuribacter pedis TaxID=442870 RepID=A0A8J7U0K6_9BACT|nr:hypothetical protein [Acanthopleuribacter pedis]MBO1317178.1 hypothetical protein [Acanthopleuribacter pedis]